MAVERETFTNRNIRSMRSMRIMRSARADFKKVKFPRPSMVGRIETKSTIPKKLTGYFHSGLLSRKR